jgi:hypothetical protein
MRIFLFVAVALIPLVAGKFLFNFSKSFGVTLITFRSSLFLKLLYSLYLFLPVLYELIQISKDIVEKCVLRLSDSSAFFCFDKRRSNRGRGPGAHNFQREGGGEREIKLVQGNN